MQKPVIAAAIALFVLVVAGGLFLALSKEERPSETAELKVYFTCDTHGRLEPCGCFTGQLGGLTRAQTWLKQNREPNSLLFDVGGAIGGEQDYHVIQYGYILQAYEKMGYQALNLGAGEARLSAKTLKEATAASKLPVLSASLVDSQSRKPLVSPTTIIEAGGRKIGLLGVLDPRSVSSPGDGLTILSLDDAISRHLPTLAAECDEVILLAFTTEAEMKRLAEEFYEITLIIGGDVGQASQFAQEVNQSLVVFTTNEARTVGEISFKRRGEVLNKQDFDIHMLYPDVKQDPELISLSKDFKKYISTASLEVDNPDRVDPGAIPGVTSTAHYVGSQSCAQCHAEETHIWKASGHGHAFKTLVDRGSQADPTCIGCHTVGFGEHSGYQRAFGDSKLVDVGCESCHGPGSEHVQSWLAGTKPSFEFRPLGPGDCKSCHHGEFSRPFDWDIFWPKIAH
ncbi:multiheme c-type cytochrome [Roseibacillus persicicus]|uniref:multiheme c-type cytochrome n=1 Tax=Roseibacillus persicicus TaxID=454148 RepID=UPI00398A51EE